jgi:hypothetical protein
LARHIALTEWSTYDVLIGKSEGKRPLGRPRNRLENMRMGLWGIEWGNVDWIHLAHDKDQWRALVNTELNFLLVPLNAENSLNGWATAGVSKRTHLPTVSQYQFDFLIVQDDSNMTGTDLCVNKPHKSWSYLNHLVYQISSPARTLGSWVRLALEASRFVFFCVCVLLCRPYSPSNESFRLSVRSKVPY